MAEAASQVAFAAPVEIDLNRARPMADLNSTEVAAAEMVEIETDPSRDHLKAASTRPVVAALAP